MKKHLINALVAVSLLATLNSCSKDEEIQQKDSDKVNATYNPLDPNQWGYIDLGDGELYFYDDSLTTYAHANKNYFLMKPLILDKYKNGELIDSICNKDIAVRFESKGLKSQSKKVIWGFKPWVANEFPSYITFNTGNTMTIRFSKMVTGFASEFNTPYEGHNYGTTIRFRNTKLDKILRRSSTYFISDKAITRPSIGMVGGAGMQARKSQTPFDEIRITFENVQGQLVPGTFDISFASFRYILANK